MYAQNLGNVLQQLPLLPAASVNSTTNGTALDLTGAPTNSTAANTGSTNYEGQIAFLLDASNISGTTPTCAIKLQTSPDNSTWTDLTGGAFTAMTTAALAQKLVFDKDDLPRYVRGVATLGGTSPVYAISLQAVVAKKYPA